MPRPNDSVRNPADAEGSATADLLSRFRDGDPDAFQAIFGEYQHRLVHFFYRLCWDADRAEDLTQELFLKLVRGARRYEPRGRLATFIFRVATNLWIDNYRSAKPRGRLYSLDQAMVQQDVLPDEQSEQPGDRLLADEQKEELRKAVSCLTEPHRLVLELAVYQEMPYAEISKVLEIPVGTVKSRMHKCVHALRERLASRDQERASFLGLAKRAGGVG